jgi:hypothetical protein
MLILDITITMSLSLMFPLRSHSISQKSKSFIESLPKHALTSCYLLPLSYFRA